MNRTYETTPLLSTKRVETARKWRFILCAIVALGVAGIIISALSKKYLNTNQSVLPRLAPPLNLRIYTNNIRYDNHNPDVHEKRWEQRRQPLTASINFNTKSGNANVVCLQEVLHNQLNDILYNLNNEGKTQEWRYYGVGRTDGKEAGEYAPILYRDEEWSLIDNRTFWLSETPAFPSKGWDAALERIVTMVTLQSKVNPLIKLNFFNTHFDHQGKVARKHSSELIVNKMRNYNEYPSFLCGDFNTEPTDQPYQILTEEGFKDSRILIDFLNKYGHTATFTGFDVTRKATSIIDYIWAPSFATNGNIIPPSEDSNNKSTLDRQHKDYKIEIKSFGVLENYFRFHFSDHRPVAANYEISKSFF